MTRVGGPCLACGRSRRVEDMARTRLLSHCESFVAHRRFSRHHQTHALISLFLPSLVAAEAWRTRQGGGVEALVLTSSLPPSSSPLKCGRHHGGVASAADMDADRELWFPLLTRSWERERGRQRS